MTLNRKEYFKEYRLKNKERRKKYDKKYNKEYYLKNRERLDEAHRKWKLKNKERVKEWGKQYYLKNIEHEKERTKKWRLKNPEYKKEWLLKHPGHYNEWQRNKTQNDPNFRLRRNLRKRLWAFLKGKNKSASTMELIGCTLEQLWVHLELSPKWEPWMTRENYGRSGGWDIDHIKACVKFDSTDPTHQRECMNWSNLQPMEHIENIKKGGR